MNDVCTINKKRFLEFMDQLSVREDVSVEVPEDGESSYTIQIGNSKFTFHIMTFTIDDNGSFVGGNGNWDKLLNEKFKTNK